MHFKWEMNFDAVNNNINSNDITNNNNNDDDDDDDDNNNNNNNNKLISQGNEVDITKASLEKILVRMSNWKSPGLDLIQGVLVREF